MGPVRQNPIQRTVSLFMCVCASHCAQLLHTILHRTDLIVFPLTLQTITTSPMMSIWGKGEFKWKDAIPGFTVLQGSAEPLDRWGGKTKHHVISYVLRNNFAKNYRNQFMCVKIIASQRWGVFWDTVYFTKLFFSSIVCLLESCFWCCCQQKKDCPYLRIHSQ